MNAAPGWYDDPEDEAHLRYFDGSVWPENVSPKQPATPALSSASSSRSWVKWLVVGIVTFVLLAFAGCTVAGALAGSYAARQVVSDTTERIVEELVNADVDLPNGKYVIPEAMSVGAGGDACVFSGAAVPTDDSLQGEYFYVTLGAMGEFCAPVGVTSGSGPSGVTVEFTVKDKVAVVTRVRSLSPCRAACSRPRRCVLSWFYGRHSPAALDGGGCSDGT